MRISESNIQEGDGLSSPGEEEIAVDGWSVVSEDENREEDDVVVHDAAEEAAEEDTIEGEEDEDDDHLYPPFASTTPIQTEESAPPPFIPQTIEVNAESGSIYVEGETTDGANDGSAQDGTKPPSQDTNPINPFRRLTKYQKCWLIVFVRKWARKVGTVSRQASIKYIPKIKPVARRSATAIQQESKRAASFVRRQSVKFDETHQVRAKAMSSIQVIGHHVQRASKATVESMKEVEEKHHIMRKSKNSIKKGGRMLRNAWNGKPLNTKPNSGSRNKNKKAGNHNNASPQQHSHDEEQHGLKDDTVASAVPSSSE